MQYHATANVMAAAIFGYIAASRATFFIGGQPQHTAQTERHKRMGRHEWLVKTASKPSRKLRIRHALAVVI